MTRILRLPFLLLSLFAHVQAEEVAPGSLQDAQAQKFVGALGGTRTACSAALVESEESFLCATIARDAQDFRTTIDVQVGELIPTGPWTAYTNEDGQQRSFLYKDGFMTVTYFPPNRTSGDSLIVVHYVVPND